MPIILLAGCAAQRAFNDAQDLSANNRVEAAIVKYREALKLEPNNPEYRLAYERTRERSVRTFLEKGDQFSARGQRTEAEKFYRRVLTIEPNNDQARAGLQRLGRDAHHEELLESATADMGQKNIVSAKMKLATVLDENPKNETAIAMMRDIEQGSNDKAQFDAILAGVYKRPISIEFKEASLKQVFEVIAQASGLNIILDKDIKFDQKTSIFLKNSTVEAAIYYMLMVNQLDKQILDANTLLIYPSNAGKQKDYQQLVVRSFMLANASAKTVAETLKTIVKTRDVVVDEKLNMIIVRDSPEAIALAEKLVATQDVPEPEVMLEVEILEISRDRLLELGIELPGSLTLTPLPSSTALGLLTAADLGNMKKATVGATIDSLNVKAKATDSDTKTLANPRIRVLNRETAKILIGNRVPSVTSTSVPNAGVAQSVTYLDVGLKLEVQPTIYLDNDIAIRVGLEVSNIVNTQTIDNGQNGKMVTYTIGTRNANTVLRLKDGENQVLAGLINDDDQRTANKFPGLGDFPVLGRLFGSTTNDKKKSELVLSITPHLIRNVKRPDASIQEFSSGTENSLRLRPDLTPRASAAALAPVQAPIASTSVPAPVVPTPSAPVNSNLSPNVIAPAPLPVPPNVIIPPLVTVMPAPPMDSSVPPSSEPFENDQVENQEQIASSKKASGCTAQKELALSCQ